MNLEHAQERIRQLESIIGLRDVLVHGFTISESKIIGLLLRKGTVTKEMLYDSLYGSRPESDIPDLKTIDVLICKLRAKLKQDGVEFKTWHGVGYFMEESNKQKLRAFGHGVAA